MLVAWIVIRSESGAPISTPILSSAVAARKQKQTAFEKDGGGNWGTTFWSNYYWSCQHLGQAFSQPKAFYIR